MSIVGNLGHALVYKVRFPCLVLIGGTTMGDSFTFLVYGKDNYLDQRIVGFVDE